LWDGILARPLFIGILSYVLFIGALPGPVFYRRARMPAPQEFDYKNGQLHGMLDD
jgi:uncharacterized membrane protein